MTRTPICYKIPGGLYGNDPGTCPARPYDGSVVVETTELDRAIRWLLKRAHIKGIRPAETIGKDESIIIYSMKGGTK